jgi:hypothetical protein
MKRTEIIILSVILILGFALRLYKFNAPIADWHSWRQVDTSSVSRTFVEEGFNLLYPKYHDLSNVPSGIHDNPQGFRFVEFPIYNALQAGGFLLFKTFSIEEWGRLVTIFSSLIASFLLYLILKRHSNTQIALLGAFFYSILPFNIFWGRTVLPDQTAITATLASLYFFDKYLEALNKKNNKKIALFILSSVCFALAVLLKPFAVFFFIPGVYLAFKKFGIDLLKRKDLWLIGAISVLPFILWRLWMLPYPAGVPQSGWLFNGSEIRFKGAFFHWIFAKRVGELILGFWGVAIFVIGVVTKKKDLFFLSFLLSCIVYLTVVATGNVTHSYYQVLIMPTIAIFMALGSYFLLNPPAQFISKSISRATLIFCIASGLAFSWYQVRDYYNIQNNSIIIAGNAVDRLTPKDAKVIAPYEGDTTFLYFTKRKGWPSFSKPIEKLIKDGADYLVLVSPAEKDYEIGKKFRIVESSPDYIIFDLSKR